LINDPREIIKTGDRVKAQIIGIDDTRISLSIKALNKDPWSDIEKKHKVGDIVEGIVDKINPFGAFVYLNKDIHGLAHVSEFQEVYPEKKMEDILESGKTYKWKILSIDSKEHRMGLMIIKGGKEKKADKPEKKNIGKKGATGKKEKTKKKEIEKIAKKEKTKEKKVKEKEKKPKKEKEKKN